MKYEVLLYETKSGHCPVLDFLRELAIKNQKLHQRLLKQLEKLENSEFHREPFTKLIGDEIFELRVLGTQAARALYFYKKNHRIIVLHAFKKRSQQLPINDRKIGLERMRDHLRRFPDE